MKIQEFKDKMWYCSVTETGEDGDPVHLYLNKDGGWNKTASYWGTKEQVEERLSQGIGVPDFTLSEDELGQRAAMRACMEDDLDDEYWDDLDDEYWDRDPMYPHDDFPDDSSEMDWFHDPNF